MEKGQYKVYHRIRHVKRDSETNIERSAGRLPIALGRPPRSVKYDITLMAR
jgi:hypothetical protein